MEPAWPHSKCRVVARLPLPRSEQRHCDPAIASAERWRDDVPNIIVVCAAAFFGRWERTGRAVEGGVVRVVEAEGGCRDQVQYQRRVFVAPNPRNGGVANQTRQGLHPDVRQHLAKKNKTDRQTSNCRRGMPSLKVPTCPAPQPIPPVPLPVPQDQTGAGSPGPRLIQPAGAPPLTSESYDNPLLPLQPETTVPTRQRHPLSFSALPRPERGPRPRELEQCVLLQETAAGPWAVVWVYY